jgi:hypothetical protein
VASEIGIITARLYFFIAVGLISTPVLNQTVEHLSLPQYLVWPTLNYEGPQKEAPVRAVSLQGGFLAPKMD